MSRSPRITEDEAAGYLEVWGRRGAELVRLDAERSTIGRGGANSVSLDSDPSVSHLHAVVDRYATGWCIRDAGSSNGTFLNGKRVVGDRRLRSGDEICLGSSRLVFRVQNAPDPTVTATAEPPPHITGREQAVLIALCRPLIDGDVFTTPATVRQMAEELAVGEAAVKFHLANLYDKFAIEASEESRRVQLANEAIRRRAVTLSALREPPTP